MCCLSIASGPFASLSLKWLSSSVTIAEVHEDPLRLTGPAKNTTLSLSGSHSKVSTALTSADAWGTCTCVRATITSARQPRKTRKILVIRVCGVLSSFINVPPLELELGVAFPDGAEPHSGLGNVAA